MNALHPNLHNLCGISAHELWKTGPKLGKPGKPQSRLPLQVAYYAALALIFVVILVLTVRVLRHH